MEETLLKTYKFEYNYEINQCIISSDEPDLKYLESIIKCYPSELHDFVNGIANELYFVKERMGTIFVQRDILIPSIGLKFYIIKGKYYVDIDKFCGEITDETSLNSERQQKIQGERLKSLGSLAGGVAHDFNNQLMIIMGSCELLKLTLTDPVDKKYLKSIEISAKNSNVLINKLLSFGQPDNVPTYEFNVVDCVNDFVEMLIHTSKNEATILYDCFAKEAVVEGNYSLLQNAFLNIGKNALEALNDQEKEGLIMVHISSSIYNDAPKTIINKKGFMPGEYVNIRITDNGMGVDESILNQIFEPFFTTKKFAKGTGLGLSTVLGTIEGHNGFIGVESLVGKGTEISIYLKKIKGDKIVIKEKPKQILIVDDEYLVRMIIRDMLIELGFDVVSYESGEEAIEYYKENIGTVGLVICDMMMPEMNGKQVFEKLKEIDDNVKFAFLSGYSNEDNLQLDKNLLDYLAKPVMLRTLYNLAQKALK